MDENIQVYQFKIFAVDLGEPLVERQSTYSQRQISNWQNHSEWIIYANI